MAGKTGGLINRLLMGKEKSEGYARASLPSNRWELFWDIFKGRFWKLVIINLLVLLFFIPFAGLGASYPFAQGFGVGYQAPVSLIGYEQQIVLNVNLIAYLLLPLAVVIAAVGVAGGAYVLRNMVWTEGIFVANDFWRGIKLNIKPMLFIVYRTYVFSVVLSYKDSHVGRGLQHGRRYGAQMAFRYLEDFCDYLFAFLFRYDYAYDNDERYLRT